MRNGYESKLFEILDILRNEKYDSDEKVQAIHDTITDDLGGLYKRYLIEKTKEEIRRQQNILDELEAYNVYW